MSVVCVSSDTSPPAPSPPTGAVSHLPGLPANYNFEIPKTVQRIKEKAAKRVALQFPEGLLMFSVVISDLIEQATGAECVILGDVTYGACCVDDLTAASLGCDFLVHYGHSCLISVKESALPGCMMYVFVEIGIDVRHFIETVKAHVPSDRRVLCVATVQFISAMRAAIAAPGGLKEHFATPVCVPQAKPLSGGELLGCTSPKVDETQFDVVIYLADGRFHLESLMIHNPKLACFLQYDPYQKVLTRERYDFDLMRRVRWDAIERARSATRVGLVMGTLGRQGNPRVVDRMRAIIEQSGRECFLALMSEVMPDKLAKFPESIGCFVQVACPRLSIDWGYAFHAPLLSPYECEVAFGTAGAAVGGGGGWGSDTYPMDHYAASGGKWAVYTDKGF